MNRKFCPSKALIICAVVAFGGLFGCASSPAEKSTEIRSAQLEDLGVDAEVEGLVFTGDTPFVLRLAPDQWSSVQEQVESLFAAAPLSPYDRRDFEQVVQNGPVNTLLDYVGLPSSFVDPDRSVWVTAGIVGGADAVNAASMGLAWLPDAEFPMGSFMRIVIPVTDADAAAEAVRPVLQEAHRFDTARVVAHARHLQIDTATTDSEAIWPEIDDAPPAPLRHTPALKAFLEADAPVSLYARTAELQRYSAAQIAFDVGRALPQAAPPDRMRILSMGTDTLLVTQQLAPRSQREFEDFTVVAGTADNDGLRLDSVATRTALGRELFAAEPTAVELSTIGEVALPDDDLLIDLRWQRDLPSLAASSSLDSKSDPVSLDDLLQAADGGLRDLHWMLADAFHVGGWTTLAGFAQSPTYLPRLALTHVDNLLRELTPIAARLRIVELDGSTLGSAPTLSNIQPVMLLYQPEFAGALVLRFSAAKESLENALAPWASMLQQGEPFGLTYRAVDIPGGGSELHIALGHDLDHVIGGQRESLAPGLRAEINPAAFAGITGGPQQDNGPSTLAQSGPLHLHSVHSPGGAAWTLVAGSNASEPTAPSTELSAVQNPPECLDRMVEQGFELFVGMERLMDATLDDLHELLEPYDTQAQSCAEKAPEYADALHRATGRARWMVLTPARWRLDSTMERVDACNSGHLESCELLEHDDPDDLRRLHEGIDTLLASGCERGDQVSCDARDALPELDALIAGAQQTNEAAR